MQIIEFSLLASFTTVLIILQHQLDYSSIIMLYIFCYNFWIKYDASSTLIWRLFTKHMVVSSHVCKTFFKWRNLIVGWSSQKLTCSNYINMETASTSEQLSTFYYTYPMFCLLLVYPCKFIRLRLIQSTDKIIWTPKNMWICYVESSIAIRIYGL